VSEDIEFHSIRARHELDASRRAKSETAAMLHLRLSSLHMEQARTLRQESDAGDRRSAA
jgi:hypothetical protein